MAAPGDENGAFDNPQHRLESNAEKLHQSSPPITEGFISDRSDKNIAAQGSIQDDTKAGSSTTTAALDIGTSFDPSLSSSSLPPGLASSSRGRGRGRGTRSFESSPAYIDGNGWRSRPPLAFNGGDGRGSRGRGGGITTSIRGGYHHTSSPTSSPFLTSRRGGKYGAYQDTTHPIPYQKQAFQANNFSNNNYTSITVDGDDAPPPGFNSSENDECPPPGYNLSDTSEDDGPPPGFEEEDGPPPGFEKNSNTDSREILQRGGSANGNSIGGRGRGHSSQYGRSNVEISYGSSRGGRGGGRHPRGGINIAPRIYSSTDRLAETGVKKVLEVPRNRSTSASSSYTSSVGHGNIFHISQSPIPAAAVAPAGPTPRIKESFSQGGERFPPLKTAAQQPIFPDFTSPSSHFSSFSPNFVDETSSALQQIALGGVPTRSATSSGGNVAAATMVSTPEQPAPLIPPMPSTLQITPLYPQIGIKSIW